MYTLVCKNLILEGEDTDHSASARPSRSEHNIYPTPNLIFPGQAGGGCHLPKEFAMDKHEMEFTTYASTVTSTIIYETKTIHASLSSAPSRGFCISG
jgi:hypothetical protein